MLSVIKIFLQAKGARPGLVLACLILAGMAEAVSMGTLLPTASAIAGAEDIDSPLHRIIHNTFAYLGIPATLPYFILVVSSALILKAVLAFLAMAYAGYAQALVATTARTELLKHLFDVRWSYFVTQRVGRIANAISNDATRIGDAFFASARFVAYSIQALVYILVALLISPKLAVGGLVIAGGLMLILGILVRVSRRAGLRQTDRTRELVTHVSDAFNNIKPLKSMNRQEAFSQLFAAKIRSLRRALIKRTLAKQGRFYGQDVLTAICLGTGVYVAAVVFETSLPVLVAIGIVLYQAVAVAGRVQMNYQAAVELESAYWRINELINETEAEREPDTGTRQPTLNKGCRFDGVSFAYPDHPVVDSVDLEIAAGEITVLIGPSGAGKTTLIDLLLGFYRPDKGRILIDDVPLQELSLKQWRSMIGYVPQELSLLHGSIRDNITLGDEAITDEDVREALRQADALGFVMTLPEGLDTTVGERGIRLSGGQRQRIALARALAHKPRLVILDEVTSALDPHTERAICARIAELAGHYTIVAITHREAWLEIASNLYSVEHGKVFRSNFKEPVSGHA